MGVELIGVYALLFTDTLSSRIYIGVYVFKCLSILLCFDIVRLN